MSDLYSELRQLYQYFQYQEAKLAQMEKALAGLIQEIKMLKERPPIHVDRIEYAFDQLKIENLDGTLNIGVNPADLSQIDDMAIPAAKGGIDFQDDKRSALKQALSERLLEYVEAELPKAITDSERQLKVQLNQEYHNFIKNDLKNQIPQRIDYYINQLNAPGADDRELFDKVLQQIKADMEHAVHVFISKLPPQMNGGAANGT
ncbi:spore germination protein GerPC [Weizmannia acidilactici]|uniref:spore germination protein GerPC n=1 Tax=Weizmannia acidilactici TaxID=2607726 RepID=UPI00124D0D2F|nr:spore germination protein GerPC [Weizmannia acidilactici]GER65764.1 germination protein PC [Weizmannia acidilactici]GER72668.1 germination protein PC [Weizmannia acidilactici]